MSKKDIIDFPIEETQESLINDSVIVTALDPVYSDRGQLSYGFTIESQNVTYSFRTNQQGYLELNGSGVFFNNYVLGN